jgi:hypothetical protein
MNLILSNAHLEHALPLMAELDLPRCFEAFERLQKQKDPAALSDLITAVGSVGQSRLIRRLGAVVFATAEELLAAEEDPAAQKALELRAAQKPFMETFKTVMAFFPASGASPTASPGSFAPEKVKAPTARTHAKRPKR